jgi:sec-independent protein translocase protein TatB
MFDIGWQELLVIGVVALIVIGPKDMPIAIRAVSRWAAKARALAREFQQGIDEVVREAELQEVKKQIEHIESLDAKNAIAKTVDPTGEIAKGLDLGGIEKSLEESARALTDESASAPSATPPSATPPPAVAAPAEPPATPAKPTGTG